MPLPITSTTSTTSPTVSSSTTTTSISQGLTGVSSSQSLSKSLTPKTFDLASNLHPENRTFENINELTQSKLEFSRESWVDVVRSYNNESNSNGLRLRVAYPKDNTELTTNKKENLSDRIIGFGSDGKAFKPSTMDVMNEKLHKIVHTAIHHTPDLASTGFEMATHTLDPKALSTAVTEVLTAMKESHDDLKHGDYKALAVHIADAAAGTIRSGASVASVVHHVSNALETVGVGIPGIGLLVKLTGDAMWYSAQHAKEQVHNAMDSSILKDPIHKARLNKLD
ncbi:hypothetical protein [Shewanella surugensis]|uniref:Uncharacterized protein n=1 Tax=Shewanella surugensis TaxID=212020 RepID=A0ABT0LIR5_9GAMM|nr:hypothetical protein [Shewanella surugensis]MCL1127597.1 hypothetical protein [Shewanella surugensis]